MIARKMRLSTEPPVVQASDSPFLPVILRQYMCPHTHRHLMLWDNGVHAGVLGKRRYEIRVEHELMHRVDSTVNAQRLFNLYMKRPITASDGALMRRVRATLTDADTEALRVALRRPAKRS